MKMQTLLVTAIDLHLDYWSFFKIAIKIIKTIKEEEVPLF